jgi:hypothetical protein
MKQPMRGNIPIPELPFDEENLADGFGYVCPRRAYETRETGAQFVVRFQLPEKFEKLGPPDLVEE